MNLTQPFERGGWGSRIARQFLCFAMMLCPFVLTSCSQETEEEKGEAVKIDTDKAADTVIGLWEEL